jgi:molybdopterin-guanine dinucleotide biosynthesis protein A
MMWDMEVLGAVLAGGAGKRVGGAKAALELCGRPLIAYPIAAMREAGMEPVVIAKHDTPLPKLDVTVVHDASSVLHPLAGVLAALDHADGAVVVVATDMPDVPPQLLRRLAEADEGADVVVAMAGGQMEPLCARYSPGARPALERALADEAPLRATVAALNPLEVATDAAAVRNVNTLDDLAG